MGCFNRNIEVLIDDSDIYTRKEIESAINVVRSHIKEYPKVEIKKLSYDEVNSNEKKSLALVGVESKLRENEYIVIQANFYIGDIKENDFNRSGLSSFTEYIEWDYYLIKDLNSGSWKLVNYSPL